MVNPLGGLKPVNVLVAAYLGVDDLKPMRDSPLHVHTTINPDYLAGDVGSVIRR